MHLRVGLLGLTGAVAAILACNGGGDTATTGTTTEGTGGSETGGTTGELIEFADFFVTAEQTYCAWATRCGAFADEEACDRAEFFDVIYPRALLGSGMIDRGDQPGTAVEYLRAAYETGRIEFDGEAAAACFAYVEARGCLEPRTFALTEEEVAGQAACNAMLRGTMWQNGPCLLSLECAPVEGTEVTCGFSPNCFDACCLGGCRTLGSVPLGTPCNFQTRCEAGSFCATDPNTGLPTVCTAQKKIGGSCTNFNECDPEVGFCDFGLGACVALGEAGDACADFGDAGCKPGFYCADPNFLGDGKCYAYAEAGGSCLTEWYEDGCNAFGVGCNQSGKCAALPGAGDPCGDSWDESCSPATSCDYNTNRCRELSFEGGPCDNGARCAGSLLCQWDEATYTSSCVRPAIASVCPVPAEDAAPMP